MKKKSIAIVALTAGIFAALIGLTISAITTGQATDNVIGVAIPQTLTDTYTFTGGPTIKGVHVNTVTKSTGTTYTALNTDDMIFINASTAFTLNLPAASTSTGKIYYITNTHATATTTIDPNASETVNGSATDATMDAQYDTTTIQCNGTGWYVLDKVRN